MELYPFEELVHFISVLKFVCRELMIDYDFLIGYPLMSAASVTTAAFISNSLVICLFFFLCKSCYSFLTVLLIFQRNQLLISFIFLIAFMFSVSFISAFIFIIFFFLLSWVYCVFFLRVCPVKAWLTGLRPVCFSRASV